MLTQTLINIIFSTCGFAFGESFRVHHSIKIKYIRMKKKQKNDPFAFEQAFRY